MVVATAYGEDFSSDTSNARLLSVSKAGCGGSMRGASIAGAPPTALSAFATSVLADGLQHTRVGRDRRVFELQLPLQIWRSAFGRIDGHRAAT